MAIRRRGRRLRPRAGLTPAQRRWFLNPFTALEEPDQLFAGGEGEAREIWEENRGEWLAEYSARYPGQRPPAWWRFDSPQSRGEVVS